jgi:hypothetical protein
MSTVAAASRRAASPRRAALLAVGPLRPEGCFSRRAASLAGSLAAVLLESSMTGVVAAADASMCATVGTEVGADVVAAELAIEPCATDGAGERAVFFSATK